MERATKDDKQVQRKNKNKMFHSPKFTNEPPKLFLQKSRFMLKNLNFEIFGKFFLQIIQIICKILLIFVACFS